MTLRLPLLEPHVRPLEKCVYCPKLCRASCPVSHATGSEAETPWGMMSSAYFMARGDLPIRADHAATAWACTGCYACKERCDHDNDVATVLADARADLFAKGAAPAGATQVVEGARDRAKRLKEALTELSEGPGDAPGVTEPSTHAGGRPWLLGCGYVSHAPSIAKDAIACARLLEGAPPRVELPCCGQPLLAAGDRAGFAKAAAELTQAVGGASLVVVDPGCAKTILVDYARVGVAPPKVELFIDLALAHRDRLRPKKVATAPQGLRFHDPCQLGRGLGVYESPRALIEATTGQRPLEFERNRERADCSGAGSLLPVTHPAASEAAARARLEQHETLGGGPVAVACASSGRRFSSLGHDTVDLVTLVARSLGLGSSEA